MKRVPTTLVKRIAVLSGLSLLLASGLTVSPVTTAPAQAAIGICNTTTTRDVPSLGGSNYYRVPARTGNGLSCYMGYRQGSRAAVEALQHAIAICYPGTWAARRIGGYPGADGIYGPATEDAVRWLQNRFDIHADGVYGPQTRAKLKWPHYYQGALLDSCSNPGTF